jgi:hypothetical protein
VWNQTEIDSESVHKDAKCQQDKPQYNEKAVEDIAIVRDNTNRDSKQTAINTR